MSFVVIFGGGVSNTTWVQMGLIGCYPIHGLVSNIHILCHLFIIISWPEWANKWYVHVCVKYGYNQAGMCWFLKTAFVGKPVYASVFVCVPVRACVSTCMPLDY